MSLKTIKLEFPVISLGMTMVSLNVPIVKRITFDFEGVIKEFVPGISILNALFEIIQKAEEFRKELEEKVDYMISVAINPVLEALQNLQDEIITSIEKIEDRYSQISRELEDFAGEHSEVISQQAALQAEKISDLFKQLEPINNAIEKIESIHKKALELTKSIKLV
jgi:DNA repair exonuclease SbcCD ATPase subunit